jgi:hypothetical protein
MNGGIIFGKSGTTSNLVFCEVNVTFNFNSHTGDNCIMIAWTGNTSNYKSGSNNDLVTNPTTGVTAKWDINSSKYGISYANGSNTGFIEVSDVTVTSITRIKPDNPLNAWTLNDQLHIEGLTVGEPFSVYTVSGVLVYKKIAETENTNIPLQAKGVYLITHNNRTIKVIKE